ncbi:hypothetical protein BU17DRAFT_65835 [Hysterangium stoloniferum]|nr:hypothetical protein BU17DRAFT_65835 [Hysterangium stoloniferum]
MRCPTEVYQTTRLRRLPHELYHHHILPTLLSEHLHQILVDGVEPKWHPFYTLPLVSRAFYSSYVSLCITIFGLLPDEGLESIPDILEFAMGKWDQANDNAPGCAPGKEDEITYMNLMSSHSLIQVYICAAIAESFFKADVLAPMWKNCFPQLADLDEDQDEEYNVHTPVLNNGRQMRRFKMKDDRFHRLYRPFTCAMRLCDTIKPASLAYIAANYLANQVPIYGSNLEMYIVRPYNLPISLWIEWTDNTLDLLENTDVLVDEMQDSGILVQSFKDEWKLPPNMIRVRYKHPRIFYHTLTNSHIIKDTGIIGVLEDVSQTKWDYATERIQDAASSLLVKFEDMMQYH